MAENNAEWFAKGVLRAVASMEQAQTYFDRLKRQGYTVKGKTLTEDETADALAKCRVHFGLGPRGGASKATRSRMRSRQGQSVEEQDLVKDLEKYRVLASKARSKKRKLDEKAALAAAGPPKVAASAFQITKQTKAELLDRAQGLDIPQWLRYEIVRKAGDSAKLGLVLALVDRFVAIRPSLKDPVSWLKNALYNLHEPAVHTSSQEHGGVVRRQIAGAEEELRRSLCNDGVN